MKYKTKLFNCRNTTIYLKSLDNCRQYCRICHTDIMMIIRGSIEYRWRWFVHYNSEFPCIVRGSPFVMSSLSNLIKGSRLILVKDDINSEKTRIKYLFPVNITPEGLVHANYSGPRTMFYLAQYIRAQERQQEQQQEKRF